MDVSVIIPCFNAADLIGEQLDALADQQNAPPFEVVVVDDGSTDTSVDEVLERRLRFAALRVLKERHRGNVAHVRNRGVEEASGRFLLFCDADDVVDRRWVASLSTALADHEFVAGALDFERLNPAWAIGPGVDRQRDGLQTGEPPFLPFAGAGNLGIRREVFDAVGGFDPALPSLEDTDLCFRAQLRGHQLSFVPEALVHVRQRPSYLGAYRQGRSWGHGTVVLHRRYRPHGMPRSNHFRHLVGWLLALPRLASVRGRGDLVTWLFRLGWRVGRLRGLTRPTSRPN